MKVLVIAHYQNDNSPTASFIHDQVKELVRSGCQVLVIVPISAGKRDYCKKRISRVVRRVGIDGAMHLFVRYPSLSRFGEGAINNHSAIASILMSVLKDIRSFNPDIIHAHTIGLDSNIGMSLKKRLKCPLVVTTHGSDATIPLRNGKEKKVCKDLRTVDVVVCVSSKLMRMLENAAVPNTKKVVLNGYCANAVPSEEKVPFSLNQTSSLTENKKVDVTICSVAMLKDKYPGIRLSVIGQGPKRIEYERLAQELGISESVVFCGQKSNDEVQMEMSRTQFFVMPSVNEGFGIVYLEAMAAGCITIGTRGEGIEDVIVSGENGFLVNPGAPKEIFEVIDWCIQHPTEAAEIAIRGKIAVEELTWGKNAQNYLQLYRDLIEETARREV